MSNINLLPWRQQLRERQRNSFFKLIVLFFVIGLIGSVAVYCAFSFQINRQNSRNNELQTEIAKVDEQIKEISALQARIDELNRRMQAIDTLQHNRNIVVHLFSDLPSLVSSGVYLKSMDFNDHIISVHGLAESNPRVSSMLRNIDNSQWLGNGSISQTKADSRDGQKLIPTLPDGLYQFDMAFGVIGESSVDKQKKGN